MTKNMETNKIRGKIKCNHKNNPKDGWKEVEEKNQEYIGMIEKQEQDRKIDIQT